MRLRESCIEAMAQITIVDYAWRHGNTSWEHADGYQRDSAREAGSGSPEEAE